MKLFYLLIFCPVILFSQAREAVIDFSSKGTTDMKDLGKQKAAYVDTAKCSPLIMEVADRMTGDTFMTTRNDIVIESEGDEAISITLIAKKAGKMWLMTMAFVTSRKPCIDEKKEIFFLYEDGSRSQMKSSAEYNCKGISKIIFLLSLNADFASDIMTKKVKAIRVMDNSSFTEGDLTDEQANYLQQSFTCLYGLIYY